MKFIPLVVTTPLIPRLLDDSKTMTRRIANIPPLCEKDLQHILFFGYKIQEIPCPYEVEDVLWVKEEHYAFGHWWWVEGEFTKRGKEKEKFFPTDDPNMNAIYYSDDLPDTIRVVSCRSPHPYWNKRLARFMPGKYARIFLEITDIRLERLQHISEADAQLEGVDRGIYREGPNTLKGEFHLELNHHAKYRDGFRYIFQVLHGRDVWEANPIVWVISFKRIPKPQNFPHA